MGGITANWHLSALDIPGDDDPFRDIAEVGRVIDLTTEIPKIAEELRVLNEREANLTRSGIVCDLKLNGQECWRCPAYTEDLMDPVHHMCRIGRKQEEVYARGEAAIALRAEADELAENAGVPWALEHAEAAGIPEAAEMAEALA